MLTPCVLRARDLRAVVDDAIVLTRTSTIEHILAHATFAWTVGRGATFASIHHRHAHHGVAGGMGKERGGVWIVQVVEAPILRAERINR